MIFKQLLLLSVPSGCLVWAAQQPANFAQVVGRLNGLEDSASQGNADVSGVNAVNGLTTEPSKIGADIQVIVTTLNELVGNDTGITPSSDTAVEEQVTNGFNGFTNALAGFMTDLANKASDLNELGQGGTIATNLTALLSSYIHGLDFLVSIVASNDAQDDINEIGSDGFAAIHKAQGAY